MPPGNAAQHSGNRAPSHFYYGLKARTGTVLVGLNRHDVAPEIAGELFRWCPESQRLPYTLEPASEALQQPRTTAILKRVNQYLGVLYSVLQNAAIHRELTPINSKRHSARLIPSGAMIEVRGLPDWASQVYQHQWFAPGANPDTPYTPYLHPTDRGWEVGQTGIDDAHLYTYTNGHPLMGPIDWKDERSLEAALELVHQSAEAAEVLRKLQHPEQTSTWEANEWLDGEWRAKTREAMLVAADMRIELLVAAQQWASDYGHSIRNAVYSAQHLVYMQDFPLPPNMMEAPAPLTVGVNITKVFAQASTHAQPEMLRSIATKSATMDAAVYRIDCELERAPAASLIISGPRFPLLGTFPVWAHRGRRPISPLLINKLRAGTVSAFNPATREWIPIPS